MAGGGRWSRVGGRWSRVGHGIGMGFKIFATTLGIDVCSTMKTSTSLASNTGGGPGLLGASNYMKLLAASRMEENPLNFQRNTKHGIHTHCVTEDIPGGCDASDLAPAGFVSPAILTDEGSDLHRTILHAIWSVTLTHNRPCLPIASVSNEIVLINGSGMMKILPATKQVNGLQLENSIAFHMVYNGAFMRSLHGDGFSIPIRRSYENLLKGCNTDTNRSTCSAGHEGEEDSDSIESVEMEGFGPPHEITSTRKMDASKRLLQLLGIDVNFDASTYSGISHGKDKGADSNWITESRRSKKNKDKIYEKKIEVMKSHSNDGALECEARGSHNSAVVCLDGSDDQCVESYREGIRLIREWCYEYGKRVDVSPIFGKKLEVFTTPSRGLFYLILSHKNREVTLILHGRSLYFIAWIGGKGTFELADDRKVLGNIGQKLSKVAANYSKLCNICDVKIGLVALRRAFEVLYKSDGRDSKDLTSSLACMIVHFPEAVRLQCVLNTICEYFPFSDKTVKSGKDLVFWIGYYGKYSSEAMDRLTSLLQGTYPDPIVNCGAGKFRSSYELIREIRVLLRDGYDDRDGPFEGEGLSVIPSRRNVTIEGSFPSCLIDDWPLTAEENLP